MTPPSSPAVGGSVHLTPLDSIPGGRIERYLGPVQLHFIKDSWSVRGEGDLPPLPYASLPFPTLTCYLTHITPN
jgi:hypothetical protein